MTVADLPELGVGAVEFGGLRPLTSAAADLIDFLEVEPATTAVQRGQSAVSPPSDGLPRLVHGVSCPLGGALPPTDLELASFGASVDILDPPWVSEHLSIDRLRAADGSVRSTGFFLPPAQCTESVNLAVERIRHLADLTGKPIAFETGVNYFPPQPGEMSDGDFFEAIAEQADCLILLDLHNLWCNEHNGRQRVRDVLDLLNLDRVVEVHLAGGQMRNGKMLDAHSGLVAPELMAMATDVIVELPNLKALTFELVPDYVGPNGITLDSYRSQIQGLRSIWSRRGTSIRAAKRRTPSTEPARGSVDRWEAALSAELGPTPIGQLDPSAIELYRHLVESVRLGAIVTVLPLTHRYLMLVHGIDHTDRLLSTYVRRCPSHAWAIDEAEQFLAFLEDASTDRVAAEVAGFEIAASRAAADGHSATVDFTVDPTVLIEALSVARRPPVAMATGHYRVEVTA